MQTPMMMPDHMPGPLSGELETQIATWVRQQLAIAKERGMSAYDASIALAQKFVDANPNLEVRKDFLVESKDFSTWEIVVGYTRGHDLTVTERSPFFPP